MELYTLTKTNKFSDGSPINGGYVDIDDDGFQAERSLLITDSQGNSVCLQNEEIAKLFYHIKPSGY
jgi:hypothetical protein